MRIHNFLIDRHEIDFEYEALVEEAIPIPNDDVDVFDENLPAVIKRNEIVNLL